MTTPTIYDLATDYARFGLLKWQADEVLSHRFSRGGVKPSFVVLHIQAGSTRGSLPYWTGVQASSTVMIQRDGSILKVIPEEFGPWTNGDDDEPTATGLRLVNLPGNSNLHTLSIEAEGESGAEVLQHPAQLDAIEWQVRDWMARYDIPLENVIRHGDINSVNRPNCPGAYYPEIIRRLKAAPPSTQPQPYPIWWDRGDVGVQANADGTKVLAYVGEVTAKRTVPLRQAADAKSPKVAEVEIGKTAVIVGGHRSKAGRRWAFIEYAPGKVGRALMSAFEPQFPTL